MAPDLRSIFAQAVSHHQAGRLDEAVACYGQALALKPDLAGAHHNLGNALWAQGRSDEAEASYRRALVHQPSLAGAHNNLGTVLLEQDRLDEAMACYRQALAFQPDYPDALNNLGAALCRWGEAMEGEACVRRALVLAPEFHRAWANLAAMLGDQGRYDEAIAAYRQLLQIDSAHTDGLNGLAGVLAARGDVTAALQTILNSLKIRETPASRRIFVDIVKGLDWSGDYPQARSVMARALTEPWARPGELAHSAAKLIKQDMYIGPCVARAAQAWPRMLTASELFGAHGRAALAKDELLHALLVSAQNSDIGLERFLTMVRALLLHEASHDAGDTGLNFSAALARQCFINEYVFFHGEEEIRLACGLRDAMAAALEKRAQVCARHLLAVAAYFPLHSLPGAERLQSMPWPAPVLDVLAQQIREPMEEAELRAAMPRLTPAADAVSRAVQTQYEENPYPRWVRMPPPEKAGTITAYLKRKFPSAGLQQKGAGESPEFLSAGCGTGQLPLAIAQSVATKVLAVDLSLSSLGYAQRKAREMGLAGIAFAQADILELGKTDRRFDIVECSGVLHHMADPFAGWCALVSLLRPGGFMLVGLYSEMARRGIVEAREYIAQRGYSASADDIRRCRQDLLAMTRNRELGAAFGDFYGISSCRDLLFHSQEQRMRLPEIGAFLENNGLTFLGFETSDMTLQAYRRRFPDNAAAGNLDCWHVFETENPDTFAGMYIFWVQKA